MEAFEFDFTNLIPLSNGMYAEDLGDGEYMIFDMNMVPLGTLTLPEGMELEDFVINFWIPLGGTDPGVVPKTGDRIVGFVIIVSLLTCLGIVFLSKRKRFYA